MEYELYDGYYDGYFEYEGDGFDNSDLIAQIHFANDWIKIAVPPIHLVVGICGNAVIAYIMWLSMSVATPLCAYAVVMAIVDTCCLLTDVGSAWFAKLAHKNFHTDFIGKSDTKCKGFEFLHNFLSHMASWITVCIAIETLRMTRDYRRLEKFKLQRIKDTVVLLAALTSIFNMHYFWTYGVGNIKFGGSIQHKITTCTFVAKNLQGYDKDPSFRYVLEQLNWVMSDFIPIVIIIIMLGFTAHAYHTCDMGKYQPVPLREHGSERMIQLSRDPRRDLIDQTFWIVLVMFVVFKAPYVIAREVYDSKLKDLKLDSVSEARWTLSVTILRSWRTANFSGKIVIYATTLAFFREKVSIVAHALFTRIKRSLWIQTKRRVGNRIELTDA